MTHRRRWLMMLGGLTALGLLLAAAPALAEDTASTVNGEIRFGIQYYLDQSRPNSAKFEEYQDVPSGFVAEGLLFSWTPSQKFYFQVDATDVTQLDQRIHAEFGTIDLWRGFIHWSENQRHWTDEAATMFTRHNGAVFTLEDSFQSAVQAASGTNTDNDGDDIWDPGTKGRVVQLGVDQGAQDVFVGHQRQTGGLGFEYTPGRSMTFSVTAIRDRRDG